MNATRLTCVLLLLGAGVLVWRSAGEPRQGVADDQAKKAKEDADLRTFMRKKLVASNQVLEGLCTDDMELVKTGARTLAEMSTAERWRVSNDPLYRQFSSDFQEITQQLVKAADANNPDRVAMKWMDATISCIDCHRFVRGMHVAETR